MNKTAFTRLPRRPLRGIERTAPTPEQAERKRQLETKIDRSIAKLVEATFNLDASDYLNAIEELKNTKD
jgi:hypothetical protein